MTSVEEALAYVRALREVLVFAGVSEVRFEQGAGRFDVNVSIRFTEDGWCAGRRRARSRT